MGYQNENSCGSEPVTLFEVTGWEVGITAHRALDEALNLARTA